MSAQEAISCSLLGDEPYDGESDPLGFRILAVHLCDAIFRSSGRTPLALGIEGSWGCGKSTLMRMVESRLKETGPSGAVRTVWFSAWTAGGSERDARPGAVLESLIKCVLEQLDPNIVRRMLRDDRLRASARLGVTLAAAWFGVGSAVDKLWDRLSMDPRARNEIQEVLKEAMSEWLARAPKTPGEVGRRVVVFIDDLDRCSPAAVFDVFEAVKLYLNAPGFVFVIGYDHNAVSDAILAQKLYSKSVTSREYIEKIIQIGFRVPPPSDEQARALMKTYLAASKTTDLFNDAEAGLIIERNGRNPRRIKRFVNRFILDSTLDIEAKNYPAALLIRALILQMYFPEFAGLYRDGMDPVEEFLDFSAARDHLRRQEPLTDAPVAKVWDRYALATPADHASALRTLESIVPEPFLALAKNTEFRSLLETLDPESKEQLSSRILRTRRIAESRATAQRPPEPSVAGPLRYSGLRILWIDSHPTNNTALAGHIESRGARIVHAASEAVARQYLGPTEGESSVVAARDPFDVVITAASLSDAPDAGLEALGRIRKDGLFHGPVIVYTARVSQQRRALAKQWNAEITASPDEVLFLLTRFSESRGKVKIEYDPSSDPSPEQFSSMFVA